jgi:hypothetical protein
MTSKEKARELVHTYRVLLMDDGEDYGEEILVSMLSKQCALVSVIEVINSNPHSNPFTTIPVSTMDYWIKVKKEIAKL